MPAFRYCCPTTGLRVQDWILDDPTARDDKDYELVI
jgi:hypothetical protein